MRNGTKDSVNWYRAAFLRLVKLTKRGIQLSSECGTGFPFPLPVWGVYTRVLPLVVPMWCNRGNRPLCGKFRKGVRLRKRSHKGSPLCEQTYTVDTRVSITIINQAPENKIPKRYGRMTRSCRSQKTALFCTKLC